jgi:CheY-like chemotaxis protein
MEKENNLAARLPLRILLAEDNHVNQKVAQAMLKSLGYQCEVVSNGKEALEALLRQTYDVVLMDMQMPIMDGLEATRHICNQWAEQQRPRIIAMTANAMVGDREMCLKAGMDDYISKPVKAADLQKALECCRIITTEDSQTENTMPSPNGGRYQSLFLRDLQEDEQEIFAELLDLFLNNAPVHLQRLREALRGGDFKRLEEAAHSLKGSCAYMGTERMVALSAELEKKGRDGSVENVEDILVQLEEEFEQFRRSVAGTSSLCSINVDP